MSANRRHDSVWLKEAAKITKADLTGAGLSEEEIALFVKFRHIMWNHPTFEIHCPQTPIGSRKGYMEVNVVTHQGEINSIYPNYTKILEITATPPYELSSKIQNSEPINNRVVTVQIDPYHEKKLIILISREELKLLTPSLRKKYNLLGAVKSFKDIDYAKSRYGGQSLGDETSNQERAFDAYAEEVKKQCQDKKGLIFWIVPNSILSLSTNDLGCLDGCIVESCLQRDPATEEHPDEYFQTQVQNLFQLFSRVLRLDNGTMRKRFVLIHDARVFEELRKANGGWLTFAEAKDAKEALRIIDDHAEPYPIKPPHEVFEESEVEVKVKEHKLTGKDGKERRYLYIRLPLPKDKKFENGDILRGSCRFEATDQKVTSTEKDQAPPSSG